MVSCFDLRSTSVGRKCSRSPTVQYAKRVCLTEPEAYESKGGGERGGGKVVVTPESVPSPLRRAVRPMPHISDPFGSAVYIATCTDLRHSESHI